MVHRESALNLVILAFVMSLSCQARPDAPRTLADFRSAKPVETLPGLPGMAVLGAADVDRWIELLQLAPDQAAEARRSFDRWIVDSHNPYVNVALPRFLDLAGKAAVLLGAEGDPTEDQTSSFATASLEAERIMVAMDALEHTFIDQLEHLAPDDRIGLLWRLRAESTRRSVVGTIGTQSRWIRFDVWAIWDEVRENVAPDALETAGGLLLRHDRDCVRLSLAWARSRLEAGRQVQRWLVDDALGRPSRDPAKLWERSAALEAAMRDLHVATVDAIVARLDERGAAQVRSLYLARTFPEVADGPELPRVRSMLAALVERCGTDEDQRRRACLDRDAFESAYAAATKAMCDVCIRWDEDVASGVGTARPQGLEAALSAQREARRALCDEMQQRLPSVGKERVGAPDQAQDAKPN